MARPIDADALMQNYCGTCVNKEFCSEESCKYYNFMRRIETAPTITAEPNHWIPCSERLPEDNQQCLIYRDIKVSNLKMTTGVYHADRKVFIGLRHGTALKDAIAWMPLPELPESERGTEDG